MESCFSDWWPATVDVKSVDSGSIADVIYIINLDDYIYVSKSICPPF